MEFGTFIRRVGGNLRRARWSVGKTQEQVAAAALTFRLLAELERGRGNPTLKTLFSLATELDVAVKDLVDVDDEKPPKVPLKNLKVAALKRGRKVKPKRFPKRG